MKVDGTVLVEKPFCALGTAIHPRAFRITIGDQTDLVDTTAFADKFRFVSELPDEIDVGQFGYPRAVVPLNLTPLQTWSAKDGPSDPFDSNPPDSPWESECCGGHFDTSFAADSELFSWSGEQLSRNVDDFTGKVTAALRARFHFQVPVPELDIDMDGYSPDQQFRFGIFKKVGANETLLGYVTPNTTRRGIVTFPFTWDMDDGGAATFSVRRYYKNSFDIWVDEAPTPFGGGNNQTGIIISVPLAQIPCGILGD